jgi:hypothetical protein
MPRRSRIGTPGALHHIIARGIAHKKIFYDNHDWNNFLDHLGGLLKETQTLCFAWALIPNHFYLFVRTSMVQVGKTISIFTVFYFQYCRNHHVFVTFLRLYQHHSKTSQPSEKQKL